MRWKILNKEKADQWKLELLEVDSNSLLKIDVRQIPKNMSILNFVEAIQSGIVLKEENQRSTNETPQNDKGL